MRKLGPSSIERIFWRAVKFPKTAIQFSQRCQSGIECEADCKCGISSVGRAIPCQGIGREFEPLIPLHTLKDGPTSFSKIGKQQLPFFVIKNGAVAKRLCTGLQIRVGRFDSGPRLHHFSFEINKIAPLRGFLLCAFWVLYLEPV